MRTHSWFCAVCLLTGVGCGASSQVERVRDARMEKIDEQTVEKTRVVEARQAAREDVIEQKHDMAKTSVAKEGMSAAALEMSKKRALYEADARGRVETIAVRVEAAKQKLGALNGKAPTDSRAQLDALESAQEGVESDVQELSLTTDSNWEAKKLHVDAGITHLDQRVADLTSKLESSS